MPDTKPLTGYPSVDKPWLKYYGELFENIDCVARLCCHWR